MNKPTMSTEAIAYHAITDLKATRRELEQARVKLATTQSENRRLRKLTQNGKRGRLLHRAAADARQLVGWRAAGYSITRRNAESYGMPRRRWIWAMGLLRVARVIDPSAPSADDFLLTEVEDCLQAIDHAVKVVESGGLERLILRMPKGAARLPKQAR